MVQGLGYYPLVDMFWKYLSSPSSTLASLYMDKEEWQSQADPVVCHHASTWLWMFRSHGVIHENDGDNLSKFRLIGIAP